MDAPERANDVIQEMVQMPVETEDAEDDSTGMCIVCCTAESDHVLVPCYHMQLCEKCSKDVIQRYGTCPTCREPIKSAHRVWR